jgi:hypothetical protein
MDIFESIFIFVWLVFLLFGDFFRRLFSSRQSEEKREYPEDSVERETWEQSDPEEEERKLKSWLEEMFGRPGLSGQTEAETPSRRDDVVYEQKSPAPRPERPAEQKETARRAAPAILPQKKQPAVFVPPKINQPLPPAPQQETAPIAARPAWLGAVNKDTLAYGFVMAEIFARPKTLRSSQHGYRHKNNF